MCLQGKPKGVWISGQWHGTQACFFEKRHRDPLRFDQKTRGAIAPGQHCHVLQQRAADASALVGSGDIEAVQQRSALPRRTQVKTTLTPCSDSQEFVIFARPDELEPVEV